MKDSKLSLELVLPAFNRGDEHAFKCIYKACWPQVFSEAYSRLKNKEDAENITQDVFTSLWEQRGEIEIHNIDAYLFTLCKHKTLNFILKKKPALLDVFKTEIPSENSPVYQLLFKEAQGQLNSKIGKLPRQQRAIIQLRYMENRSTVEIADELGLSVKTVRNHLGRALSTLRNLFKIFLIFFIS